MFISIKITTAFTYMNIYDTLFKALLFTNIMWKADSIYVHI